MQGRLASEIIFQQWLQMLNWRHLSAWVVPTKVQHKGFSFYFWEDIRLHCVAVDLRLKRSRFRPMSVTEVPLSKAFLTVCPLALCSGFSRMLWLYRAAPRFTVTVSV